MLLTCHSLGKFLFHPLRVYSGKAGLGLLVYWVSPWAGLEKNKRKFSTENQGSLEERLADQQGDQREMSSDRKRTQTGKGQEKSINKVKFS